MSDHTLTKRAEADLFDIAVHGYRQFGVHQVEAYATGLEHAFQLLADNPRMGRRADAILYDPVDDGVLILAIVHGRSVRHLAL